MDFSAVQDDFSSIQQVSPAFSLNSKESRLEDSASLMWDAQQMKRCLPWGAPAEAALGPYSVNPK